MFFRRSGFGCCVMTFIQRRSLVAVSRHGVLVSMGDRGRRRIVGQFIGVAALGDQPGDDEDRHEDNDGKSRYEIKKGIEI